MSRNGSGVYSLPVNSWNPAINGVSATAADWQNLANDIAAALTQSLSSDGQTSVTGNLPMTGNKLTGLGAGSATGDSVRWEQLFSQGTPQNLASATTTDIGAQNSVFLNITGTTTITSFGTNYNGPRYVRFDNALTLTHNATTLILPGATDITTAAGDSAIVVPSGSPANGWRVAGYQKADGSLFMRLGAVVATTSGTAIDFTGIPAWVKRITVMFWGVSTNGTSNIQVQLGAGSITTSGYASANTSGNAGVSTISATSGHIACAQVAAGNLFNGHVIFTSGSANIWIGSSVLLATGVTGFNIASSNLALAGTLDRIRLTTVNGTDTFDGGNVNIIYEG
jgi:hypothetical protein